MVKREIVEVTWIDSHTRNGWDTAEIFARWIAEELDLTCQTVGYKFGESDDILYLVMSEANPDLCHTLQAIPKAAISKVRTLK